MAARGWFKEEQLKRKGRRCDHRPAIPGRFSAAATRGSNGEPDGPQNFEIRSERSGVRSRAHQSGKAWDRRQDPELRSPMPISSAGSSGSQNTNFGPGVASWPQLVCSPGRPVDKETIMSWPHFEFRPEVFLRWKKGRSD